MTPGPGAPASPPPRPPLLPSRNCTADVPIRPRQGPSRNENLDGGLSGTCHPSRYRNGCLSFTHSTPSILYAIPNHRERASQGDVHQYRAQKRNSPSKVSTFSRARLGTDLARIATSHGSPRCYLSSRQRSEPRSPPRALPDSPEYEYWLDPDRQSSPAPRHTSPLPPLLLSSR